MWGLTFGANANPSLSDLGEVQIGYDQKDVISLPCWWNVMRKVRTGGF
jgi:hypothetical protein